jgi:hypothetical protein
MHMPLTRRVPLLLDSQRYRKVASEAERRRISVAEVIRQAIDAMPVQAERRRAAIDAILAAPPMDVPDDPADLRRESDEGHSHRL